MEVTEDKTALLLTKGNVQVSKIESNNGGRSFARNVERILRVLGNTRTMVKWYHQSLNKEARIFTQAADVQNMIYYPEDWETDFQYSLNQLKATWHKERINTTMHRTH
jgi:predicted phage terminase large subunit-like protein